jgi:hypothetical protein
MARRRLQLLSKATLFVAPPADSASFAAPTVRSVNEALMAGPPLPPRVFLSQATLINIPKVNFFDDVCSQWPDASSDRNDSRPIKDWNAMELTKKGSNCHQVRIIHFTQSRLGRRERWWQKR